MKVLLLNGSPRNKHSNSECLMQAVEKRLSNLPITICKAYVDITHNDTETHSMIQNCDAIVVFFPLYVDGIPSHLLKFLEEGFNIPFQTEKNIRLYAVINNGFYEGKQNALAAAMMESFAIRAGFSWSGACGIGAGEMSAVAPIGKGPLTSWGKALDQLCAAIVADTVLKTIYVTANFPRILYKYIGERHFCSLAKKNGIQLRVKIKK